MYLLPGGSRRCIASCKMHEPGNAAGTHSVVWPTSSTNWRSELARRRFCKKTNRHNHMFLGTSNLLWKYETFWYSRKEHDISTLLFFEYFHYIGPVLRLMKACHVEIPSDVHVWLVISIQGCTNHPKLKIRKWMILGGSVANNEVCHSLGGSLSCADSFCLIHFIMPAV